MLVVAANTELRPERDIWGTGGWLEPEDREALDWLTLARLLGWGVSVARAAGSPANIEVPAGTRWVIIACEPDHLGEAGTARLAARLSAEPLLVVARAGSPSGGFARLSGAARGEGRFASRSLRWLGPGGERCWECRSELEASDLVVEGDVLTWATLAGRPAVVARSIGSGVVVTLGLHPSAARDAGGAGTALLKQLLVWGPPTGVAWLELDGVLALRMDDAGGAQNVYCRSWSYPKLEEKEWAAVRADLRRRGGRLSIGYVAGWVDDGDAERGFLTLAGRAAERAPGRVHPSPLVKYRDRAGHAPGTVHDYRAEFRGLQALRAEGLGDVELHGYTHIHPDRGAWVRAPDRYEATSWYRELGRGAQRALAEQPSEHHPLALGTSAIRRYFGVRPTTLICPGDEWTDEILEHALPLGLQLVSSYYLAIRDSERFCWSTHVCAPYLDEPDAAWFDAGLPVVGCFHDYELALEGVGWMTKWIDEWQAAGARRLLDLRELAAAVGRRVRLGEAQGEPELAVTSDGAPELVRPLMVLLRLSEQQLPSQISATLDGHERKLPIQPLGGGIGRVLVAPSSGG